METNKNEYIRVGTTYYKIVYEPDIYDSKQSFRRLAKWDKTSIIDDHGKNFPSSVKKYDGFINFPSHEGYRRNVGGFYNEYHQLSGPVKKGNFPYTQKLLQQIFGDHLELGLDYLSILWKKPTQHLPVLCLVSNERNTGKTTFLNWMRMLLENNVGVIKKEDFKSRFNDAWVNKLIIAVDEAKFDKKEDTDYIKMLSTSKTQQREKKGVDQKQENFYGKIILASNNIHDFIVVDEEEIRFWVLEIKKLSEYIEDFDEKIKEEIPHFKYFLMNRKIKYPKSSRMWFKPEDIKTEALARVVKNSYDIDEKDLKEILLEYFDVAETETVKLTLKDLTNLLKNDRSHIRKSDITNILNYKWKLYPSESTTYKFYYKVYDEFNNTHKIQVLNKKGRVYTFHKTFIEGLI
ncbi:helicase [Psychroflexus sp. YR1-1]|uniref:Helicase n=1 Tax=Psychroflexus aurantiacus TaxID=2709310 RepID=A0A6B3QZ13_9FLAO|nr:primase-helicase family protein [Psychroflexus aurantiacus]NEV93456.1 helicase [Psychroflexus aurantiacus]